MDPPADVEVVLTHDRVHYFDSSTLRRHSTFFAQNLSTKNAVRLAGRAKNAGVTTRWRVELRELPPNGGNTGRLHLIELDSMGRVGPSYTPLMPLNENGKVPLKLFEHYENILGAFYGREIEINDMSIASALEDAVGLTEVAEYLGSIAVVSKSIDIALFKQGQVLFRSISVNPSAWADLGYRIQSELIYKETVIHLAGRWPGLTDAEKAALHDDTRAVCQKHHEKLQEKRKQLELCVVAVYPGGLTKSKDEEHRRQQYSNDVLVWVSLSYFRHWFAQNIINGNGSLSKDGGYKLYSQLAAAGDAYMDKGLMNQFYKKFTMTKKAQGVVENHLLEFKECIKQAVEKSNILESESQLDLHRHPVNYLTCAQVDKVDFPWLKTREPLKRTRVIRNAHSFFDANGDDINDMDLDENEDYKRSRNT
ncbi:hypothetical protein K432DRAFT_435034 [Lepidopterella palustris CBS 459.81]|uniref:Uncharacterized protein n=1 Tax=Lepidopterella palustris CBS 459.81 TaxID=1314670 RepID=A0A8E2E9I3_9PEZI|nr:hypothetical protein K432DRAFT_435034 [Lepidopterella palustris CBS 459.81]